MNILKDEFSEMKKTVSEFNKKFTVIALYEKMVEYFYANNSFEEIVSPSIRRGMYFFLSTLSAMIVIGDPLEVSKLQTPVCVKVDSLLEIQDHQENVKVFFEFIKKFNIFVDEFFEVTSKDILQYFGEFLKELIFFVSTYKDKIMKLVERINYISNGRPELMFLKKPIFNVSNKIKEDLSFVKMLSAIFSESLRYKFLNEKDIQEFALFLEKKNPDDRKKIIDNCCEKLVNLNSSERIVRELNCLAEWGLKDTRTVARYKLWVKTGKIRNKESAQKLKKKSFLNEDSHFFDLTLSGLDCNLSSSVQRKKFHFYSDTSKKFSNLLKSLSQAFEELYRVCEKLFTEKNKESDDDFFNFVVSFYTLREKTELIRQRMKVERLSDLTEILMELRDNISENSIICAFLNELKKYPGLKNFESSLDNFKSNLRKLWELLNSLERIEPEESIIENDSILGDTVNTIPSSESKKGSHKKDKSVKTEDISGNSSTPKMIYDSKALLTQLEKKKEQEMEENKAKEEQIKKEFEEKNRQLAFFEKSKVKEHTNRKKNKKKKNKKKKSTKNEISVCVEGKSGSIITSNQVEIKKDKNEEKLPKLIDSKSVKSAANIVDKENECSFLKKKILKYSDSSSKKWSLEEKRPVPLEKDMSNINKDLYFDNYLDHYSKLFTLSSLITELLQSQPEQLRSDSIKSIYDLVNNMGEYELEIFSSDQTVKKIIDQCRLGMFNPSLERYIESNLKNLHGFIIKLISSSQHEPTHFSIPSH